MNSYLYLSGWGRMLGKQLNKGTVHKYKPKWETARWNIVKGDIVQVINGPSTGQKGKVLTVLRKDNRIIVEGVNLRSRVIKPLQDGTPGKKVSKPCSLHYSNVMLVDPTTGEPTKVSRRFLEDGTKVRVSKKTGHIITRPKYERKKPRSVVTGPKDTIPDAVHEVTFADYEKYLPFIYAREQRKAAAAAESD